MNKSELKRHIIEALTPQEADKVDSKYKEIYGGMLKGNKKKLMKYIDPESGRPNPDKVAYGRAIKLIQKESKLNKESFLDERLTSMVREVYSEKQRKWACAQDDPKFDEMCKDTAISKKKLKEELDKNTFQRHADRVEDLLKQLLGATKAVDSSQDDTEDDVEELDKSIDYLSAALTDKDPLDIAIDQSTFGRLAKPTKENLQNKQTMKENRLNEFIKTALKGPVNEKAEANESFDSLVKKVDKEKGYTKKEAEKVAGAIAAKKMKGAGKGPTAKQKKRMAETILKELRG